MRDLILVLKAMADPTRIRILKMLEQKRMCVCELTAVLGIQQSSVSHHLRILKDAGLVVDMRHGAWIDYALAQTEYNEFAPALLKMARTWLHDDPLVKKDEKTTKQVDRKHLCNR
jgi:ArsR family transcriptional regulator